MLKVKIVSVGKIKERALKELIFEYEKRLSKYIKLETIEVSDNSISDNPSKGEIEKILNSEGQAILKHISNKSYNIALCIEGKQIDSESFAKLLNDKSHIYSEFTFIIGSSYGLSEQVKTQCDFLLSMSKMTFLHNMARLMLTEQLYRACKINNNETYHK